jgi:hypothetical protein
MHLLVLNLRLSYLLMFGLFRGWRLVLLGSSDFLGRCGRGVVGFFERHGLHTHTRALR